MNARILYGIVTLTLFCLGVSQNLTNTTPFSGRQPMHTENRNGKALRRCYWGFLLTWALTASPKLLWSQSATFSREVYNPAPYCCESLALGDFNSDGFLDLASSHRSGQVFFYLGAANGSFGAGTTVRAVPRHTDPNAWYATQLVTGDFNGDQHIDCAVLSFEYLDLSPGRKVAVVLLGDGTGHFDSRSRVTTSLNFFLINPVVGDFNLDGKLDIVAHDYPNSKAVLLPGDGRGRFGTPIPVATASGNIKAIVADFNHDGKPDLAIFDLFGSTASVYVLINSGSGFTTATHVPISSSEFMADIVATDVNHDGKIDLVACVGGIGTSYGNDRLVILQGNGTGGFSIKPSRALKGAGYLAAGDFDGDGKIDLATAGERLQILFDDGSLQFPSSISVATFASNLNSFLAADFNRDGKLDLAGLEFPWGGLNVYLNTSGVGTSLTLIVPIVLSARGLNNSFFTSELTVTNRGPNNATITYDYTAALGEGSGTATDTLAATTQKIYPDAISYLRSIGIPLPESGSRGGTLRITFSGLSSSRDGAATVRTTTIVSNGRAGLAYKGITSANVLNGTAYLCGLRQNSTDRSNAAFVNAGSSSDGPIRLHLTISSGDVAALNSSQKTEALSSQTEIILEPGGFQQISGILAGYGITNGYIKVERVSGTAPFYAYAVINDQANSDGSFVPPILESSLVGVTSLTLPILVETRSFDSELYGLFYIAIPRGKEAQSSAWLYGLQQNSENRTNLAVICTNEMDDRNPDVFRIDLYDGESGSLVGTVNNFLVNALEWKQIPAILSQYAPGVGQAYAHVVRVAGSNPFIVYAVINDGEQPGQRSGDGALVSMDVE